MAADVDRLDGHGRMSVDGFTPAQKAVTALCILVVVVVLAAVVLVKWSSTPDRRGNTTVAQLPRTSAGSGTPGGVTANGTSTQLAQTQAYEAAVEQRIENMLSDTLGPGHAAVTVAAELDETNRSSVTRRYNEVRPGSTVPITQNDDHETLASNPGSSTATPTTVYEKTQTQHHNAVDTTVTNAATPPGTLKRLSVSVLLDRAVVAPADVASVWQPSIAAAAGVDPKRDGNNALKVMTVAFSKSARKQAQAAGTTTADRLVNVAEQLLIVLVLALVLFVAWQATKRARRNRIARREPLDLRELDTVRPAEAVLDRASVNAPSGEPPVRTSLDASVAAIEVEIADLIERQPDEVAQTLRSWLADRRT